MSTHPRQSVSLEKTDPANADLRVPSISHPGVRSQVCLPGFSLIRLIVRGAPLGDFRCSLGSFVPHREQGTGWWQQGAAVNGPRGWCWNGSHSVLTPGSAYPGESKDWFRITLFVKKAEKHSFSFPGFEQELLWH